MLRCHLAAFAALGGVPRQVLYDRMKTAVTGQDPEGHIVYNRIFEAGQLIACHPVLEGRNQRRVAPGHRKASASAACRHADADEATVIGRAGEIVARRSTSTRPSPFDWPARSSQHDRPHRSCRPGARSHQADPGRPQDAARSR